jgi:hypothetical protein
VWRGRRRSPPRSRAHSPAGWVCVLKTHRPCHALQKWVHYGILLLTNGCRWVQSLLFLWAMGCDPAPDGPLVATDGGASAPPSSGLTTDGSTYNSHTASTNSTSGITMPLDTSSSSGEKSTSNGASSTSTARNDSTSTASDASSSAPLSPSGIVHFEPSGGTFFEAQALTLTLADTRPIYYTLDGSVPNETSTRYQSPITLEETTLVRTFVPSATSGAAPTYGAQPYIELRTDVLDFTSNLPLVVINRHRDVPLDRQSDELRPSSVVVFEPVDGRAALLGRATLAMRAGVRVRGAFSRAFPQVSYALEAWEAGTDNDEQVAFLGMPAESDWVLNAPSEIDRALMRNRFAMDLSRKLGHYASRATFVEVFLVDNEETASLGKSDYVGVYTALEKIKRDSDRVDVHKLNDTDQSGEALTGGYVFRIDREQDFYAGGFDFGWVYPAPEVMATSERQTQVDYTTTYLEEFFACLSSADFVHPSNSKHYSEYIDVGSFIDYNLMTALTKNVDGLRLSAYFHKDRNGPIVAGPVWDFDRSLGTPHDSRVTRADEWAVDDGTDPLNWGFWHDLFRDPEFAAAYWSRWDELRQGDFSLEQMVNMLDGYETELEEARERHFDRWQELSPVESAEHEVELIREWLAERVQWVDRQRP